MKKTILAFIVLFTQPHSFAMHTLAVSRAMRMPKSTSVIRPRPQRYSSLSKDAARKQYEETMQQAHKYSAAIGSIRKEEKEKLKNVALQGEKLKKAVDNRDIRRKTFLDCPFEADVCDSGEYPCPCHEEIKAELETLQKMMGSLELSQKSLQKVREISNEHWELRNEAMHRYHKILEAEIKNLFESKNNKESKN